MSDGASVVVLASRKSAGPWGDSGWLVGSVLQLIEGGNRGPFWFVDVLSDRSREAPSLIIDSLEAEAAAKSLVVAAFVALADREEVGLLEDDGKLVIVEGAPWEFGGSWLPSPGAMETVLAWVKDSLKFVVVPLDDLATFDARSVATLESYGVEVRMAQHHAP